MDHNYAKYIENIAKRDNSRRANFIVNPKVFIFYIRERETERFM